MRAVGLFAERRTRVRPVRSLCRDNLLGIVKWFSNLGHHGLGLSTAKSLSLWERVPQTLTRPSATLSQRERDPPSARAQKLTPTNKHDATHWYLQRNNEP